MLKSSKKRPRAVTELFVFIQKKYMLEFIKRLEQKVNSDSQVGCFNNDGVFFEHPCWWAEGKDD